MDIQEANGEDATQIGRRLTWRNSFSRLLMLLFAEFSSTRKENADCPANRDRDETRSECASPRTEQRYCSRNLTAARKEEDVLTETSHHVSSESMGRTEQFSRGSVLSPSRQCVLFTLCVATPPAGGAQPMRRSLFVYILPPPRKGNKRSRGSHFMEMCFFFSLLPLPLPFAPGTLGG